MLSLNIAVWLALCFLKFSVFKNASVLIMLYYGLMMLGCQPLFPSLMLSYFAPQGHRNMQMCNSFEHILPHYQSTTLEQALHCIILYWLIDDP